MAKQIKDITFSWEEGRYFDLWMAVHTLSGVVIGFFLAFLSFSVVGAYLIVFLALFFWEIFELYFLRIVETKENRVIDIVVGIIGFAAAFHWSIELGPNSVTALLIFSTVVLTCLTLLGWLDFHHRKLES